MVTFCNGEPGQLLSKVMTVQRITPDQATQYMEEGWIYLDVRSVPEFEAGHPRGAYNVPFMHHDGRRFTANHDFLAVVSRRFAKDEPIILGCRSAGRSLQAAKILAIAGFTRVVDMRGGYAGEADPGGKVICEGWQPRNLPVATRAEPGRSYAELAAE